MKSSVDPVVHTETMEQASAQLPTRFGNMEVKVFRNRDGAESVVIISGTPKALTEVPVRVHSACITAEVLTSQKCDCKSQLDYALEYVADHGGLVIYLPQEGRGVGLVNKIRAYALQNEGFDTVDANRVLGLPDDARDYRDAADILRQLGIDGIRLLTNNPRKISELRSLGVNITGRIPLPLMATEHSVAYLRTKQARMGHLLDFAEHARVLPADKPDILRPLIHLNMALDRHGRSAGARGEAIDLSCEKDWRRVHELREHYSAVGIGARTWQLDQPKLTAREERLGRLPRRQPERVIFAGHNRCEFKPDERRTFVVGCRSSTEGAIRIEAHDHNLDVSLGTLRKCGLQSLLVEGGLTLMRSFVRFGYIDRLTIYVRSDSMESAESAVSKALPELSLECLKYEPFGEGILVSADDYPRRGPDSRLDC